MKNSTRFKAVLCLCLSLMSVKLFAQATAPFTHQGLTASTGDFLGFLQYKPADYDQHPSTKYPIIIFLHGIGERGNGTTELDKVAYVGMPRIIYKGNPMRFTWNGKTETFLVLAPQCPWKYGMWPSVFVNDLIAYAKQNLRIDTNRIYLTGLSMGGGGSLRYISDAPADNAKRISAVATCSAPCTFGNGYAAAAAHLPVWCFHAEDDPTASAQCTKNAIAGLNQAKVSPKPLLDLWPTGGHVVWDRMYTDTNYKYQGVVNIYEWFLGQNKSLPVNVLPKANGGGDRTVNGNSIVLDASASSDADGKLVRFVWKKLSGPESGTISVPMSSSPSTTFKGITLPGKYTFEVAVVDDRASFTRDTITINVASVTAPPVKDTVVTAPPVKDTVVKAPPLKDTVVTAPPVKDTVVKAPPVKDTVVTAPPVKDTVVKAPPVKDTVVTAPPVKDTVVKAPPVKDTVVKAPPVKDTVIKVQPNKPAIANAGVEVNTNTTWPQSQLNASLTKDSDGWISKLRWTKLSGPAKYLILDSTALITYVKGLDTGVYVFRVYVTDNKGAVSFADKKITVKAPAVRPPVPANILPIAFAGDDGMTSMGWNRHILNASLSKDKDGWFKSVRWSKVSGPAKCVFLDSTSIVTYATELQEGAYTFRVTVTDNRGGVSSDDVNITVVKRLQTSAASPLVVTSDMKVAEIKPITAKEGIIDINPNPAINNLVLQYSSSATGQTSIVIYDLNGRAIKNIQVVKTENMLRQSVNINDLTNGIYYVVAKTGTKSYAPVKFIKQ